MSYQRFKKGGRVAKRQFLEKSVQKLFNKKIKTDFFREKVPFLNRRLLRNGLIFEHSHVSYGKRQKSCTLIVILVKCIVSDVSNF